jgi:hypothetical protein
VFLQLLWSAQVEGSEEVRLEIEIAVGIVIQLGRAVVQTQLSSYDGRGESARSLLQNH